MSDNDLSACIEVSAKIAKDLHSRLILYKELSIDPDSTLSIPDLNYMCELAETLVKRLESQEGKEG